MLATHSPILSVPQMQLTMQLLNEDADAELLAHPRWSLSDNQKATIKITRNQPMPTSSTSTRRPHTAVFGGFQTRNLATR